MSLAEYEALMNRAEELRVKKYDISGAIDLYLQAYGLADLEGYDLLAPSQMLGVCYRLVGDYRKSLIYLGIAVDRAMSLDRLGNVYRDMGATYNAMQDYDQALYWLDESLKILGDGSHIVEYGATLGFVARVYQDMGDSRLAKEYFVKAHNNLSAGSNKEVDLYNELHFASFMSSCHKPIKSRKIATRALWLSMRHGANAHRVRALALLIGGYRLENYLRNLK